MIKLLVDFDVLLRYLLSVQHYRKKFYIIVISFIKYNFLYIADIKRKNY